VTECPLLQSAVTVRLSPTIVETLKVSYIPQSNDWFTYDLFSMENPLF
jgi:hypothetical protein